MREKKPILLRSSERASLIHRTINVTDALSLVLGVYNSCDL
jgi:hypothetical protein